VVAVLFIVALLRVFEVVEWIFIVFDLFALCPFPFLTSYSLYIVTGSGSIFF
jgi:hypothetical protein